MKKYYQWFSIACLLFTLSSVASGQAWKTTLTTKPGKFPAIKPVQLTYAASWKGAINSGKISFIFGKKDKRYPNYYISQSYGGSAFNLFPYKYEMTSFSQKRTFRPILLIANESDKKGKKAITNRYTKSSVTHTKKSTPKKGKVKTSKRVFSAPAIHDPLTAILFIRSHQLNKGDKIHLCLHPFSSPYYVTVTVLGREMHAGRKCIKMDVAMRKIDRKTGKLRHYKKLKKATLWVSDDAQRIPIELRTKVFIGDVRLTLTAIQKP